jgi:hypothetical protein
MRRFRALGMGGRIVLAVTVGAGVFGIATAVQASIPDVNGVIHACYLKSGGALNVIDNSTSTCTSKQTALNWNQQGIRGVTGLRGPTGPKGTTGTAGANGTNGAKGVTGSKGATGQNGVNGSNGQNGLNGLNGTNGQRGPSGPTGAKGPAGTDGTAGAKGHTGATGPSGARGPTGSGGLSGFTTVSNSEDEAADGSTNHTTSASCPSGKTAVSGNFNVVLTSGVSVGAYPVGGFQVDGEGIDSSNNDYYVIWNNTHGIGDHLKVTVTVNCA